MEGICGIAREGNGALSDRGRLHGPDPSGPTGRPSPRCHHGTEHRGGLVELRRSRPASRGLDARVDRDRVAVVGHSWGAQTAGALLAARVLDTEGNPGEDFSYPAVK